MMTRNKNETPEQREKRLEKQKLYYMKRKAAGVVNQREDHHKLKDNISKRIPIRNERQKFFKKTKFDIDIEGEIFDNSQLKIPIPASLKAKLLEQKEEYLEENKACSVFDFSEETYESQTSFSEDDKKSYKQLDALEDDDDDFSGVRCDVCKKKCIYDQTLLKTNELNETLKYLLPEDYYILLKLCPMCKIYINKSCLF